MVVKSHRQLKHEREHNELADWLAERIEVLQPYAMQITLAAIAIVVAVLGSLYYFGTESQVTARDWSEYFEALNEREPEPALQSLYTKNPQSVAGLWAAQMVGDINLARGAAQMFQDREQANDLLKKAEEYYKKAEVAPNDPDLVARARLGLGKVNEALCKPEDALKYYKLVADTQKDSAIGKAAAKAAKRMENPRDVALLAWFAQQTPKKPSPLSGPGSGVPGLPNDLPDRPDITPPSGLGLDNIGTGTPDASEPSLPLPATTPPAESPPADPNLDADKPAAPAPEEKPTETKPTESKPE